MILSFRCAETRELFQTGRSRRFGTTAAVAARKLAILNAAASLEFLRSPPGNRLEALKGNRAGQYGIRINDQFRLCFIWNGSHAEQVEIVDYH